MSECDSKNPIEVREDESAFEQVTEVLTDIATGIPASVRKNFWKAFGRLCTAAVEVPTASLEGKANEIRAQSEGRIKIIQASSEQIASEIQVPAEYARRAANKFAARVIRERVNIDKVAEIAAEELKKLPSADEVEEIDDDWLNTFEKEAGEKSTEEMQSMFGKILAGEIRRPSSFSIKAIKALGELDKETAILFRKLCSIASCLIIPNVKMFSAHVISIGGNAGANALEKFGLAYDQLNLLQEAGLIISDYNSRRPFDFCLVGSKTEMTLPFFHSGSWWKLVGPKDNDRFLLHGVSLSKVGRELMPIVDVEPNSTYTEELKAFFARKGIEMVETKAPIVKTI